METGRETKKQLKTKSIAAELVIGSIDGVMWNGQLNESTFYTRDCNSAAYATARCCWCSVPRSVATKICILHYVTASV